MYAGTEIRFSAAADMNNSPEDFVFVMAGLMLLTTLLHTSGERFIDKAASTNTVVSYTASKIRIVSGMVAGKMAQQLASYLA